MYYLFFILLLFTIKFTKSCIIEEDIYKEIKITKLSNLISEHWKYDYLDIIINEKNKEIANNIQENIEIIFQNSSSPLIINNLLQLQILDEIYSQTQDILQEIWNDDNVNYINTKLIDNYFQSLIENKCISNKSVSLNCLKKNMNIFIKELNIFIKDNFIKTNSNIENIILDKVLPIIKNKLNIIINQLNKHFSLNMTFKLSSINLLNNNYKINVSFLNHNDFSDIIILSTK